MDFHLMTIKIAGCGQRKNLMIKKWNVKNVEWSWCFDPIYLHEIMALVNLWPAIGETTGRSGSVVNGFK